MISFACQSCGKRYSVKDTLAGKKTRCPACKTLLVVPVQQPLTEAVPTLEPVPDDPVPVVLEEEPVSPAAPGPAGDFDFAGGAAGSALVMCAHCHRMVPQYDVVRANVASNLMLGLSIGPRDTPVYHQITPLSYSEANLCRACANLETKKQDKTRRHNLWLMIGPAIGGLITVLALMYGVLASPSGRVSPATTRPQPAGAGKMN
jgi:hypothetical protein